MVKHIPHNKIHNKVIYIKAALNSIFHFFIDSKNY